MPGPNKKQRGLVVWKNYRTGNFLAGHSIGHPVMNSRQSERSVPWTTRGRVEINISSHGPLFINELCQWQRYISSRCVVLPTSFAAPPPGNAEYVWLYAQLRFLAPYANVD